MRDWEFEKDPHKVVPNGFYCPRNRYTVTGFAAPTGKEVRKLMVLIRYDGSTGGSTSRHYLSVLYDYFQTFDHNEFVSTVLFAKGV